MSEASKAREWDADSYERVNAPQREWAGPVIDRLGLTGDETILDAGCGGGNITKLLIERVPRGRVIAVDGSADMIRVARETLGPDVELHHMDLLDLELNEKVDAVFSNATFHWVLDHPRLFARIAAVMRPGARLSAQCGGKGNVAELRLAAAEVYSSDRFAEHFAGWEEPYEFAGPKETRERLTAAGFEDIETWLEPRPTKIAPDQARDFIRTVTLGAYLKRLPAELHDAFTDAVIGLLEDPTELAYIRLNMTARREQA